MTLRLEGSVATDPRDHHHHRSKHLGTAAKQTDGLGNEAQANGSYLSRRQREEVRFQTVGGVVDFTFRRSRGIADHHRHHRGE